MSTNNLDRAWYSINALGGWFDSNDAFDRGYDCAIGHALEVIERLGGQDPLVRNRNVFVPPHLMPDEMVDGTDGEAT